MSVYQLIEGGRWKGSVGVGLSVYERHKGTKVLCATCHPVEWAEQLRQKCTRNYLKRTTELFWSLIRTTLPSGLASIFMDRLEFSYFAPIFCEDC